MNMQQVRYGGIVADASASERSAFIRRTYAHLAGAIGLFALLEAMLLQAPFTQRSPAYSRRCAPSTRHWRPNGFAEPPRPQMVPAASSVARTPSMVQKEA